MAKSGQHSLFESWIGSFLSERFFEDFVHSFGFVMSFTAHGAFDEVRVKCAPFIRRKLAVKIGSEPVINFVVNGCHTL